MVSVAPHMGLHIPEAETGDLWDIFSQWYPLDFRVIDAHVHDGTVGAQVDHVDLINIGTKTHTDIDSHITNITTNPHAVTKANVGLGAVTNDLQVKASEKGAVSGVATLDVSQHVVQDPASKAQANGVASLDVNSKVLQNPASASVTPRKGAIPIAGMDGTIATGFFPPAIPINPILIQVFS